MSARAADCRITVESQGYYIGRRHCHTHDVRWEGAFAVGGGCPATEATHAPCCSAHDEPMTCEKYRRTHFVEVRPCCAIDAERIAEDES